MIKVKMATTQLTDGLRDPTTHTTVKEVVMSLLTTFNCMMIHETDILGLVGYRSGGINQ